MTRARDLASGLAGVRPFATASGVLSSASNNSTITLPVGRFTQTPAISVTNVDLGGGWFWMHSVRSQSTTAFTVGVQYRTDAGAFGTNAGTSINWQAIQMTSGAASG
jgi:hypothetical protein